jgi:superfamily I DNA/RNA helicase
LERSLGHSSRFVAVGDPHQAIYGFRGANSDALDKIVARFACRTLPLSVSYRCSKAVVAEAQKFE